MNKRDLIGLFAGEAGIAKPAAEAAAGTVSASIAGALARSEGVAVAGFGWFARRERAAREGRNARTGERLAIGPSSGVSFRDARTFGNTLN